MGQPVIEVSELWKRYGLPWLPDLRQWWRVARGEPVGEPPGPWALRGVDFNVYPGETVGVIGRNGSGKSTLLKILAGVTPPTRGRVSVHGTLFPMIELNAGVHMELTGRENISLLGAVSGIGSRRLASCMGAIEEFCELGEWLDRPVRTYSSGMLVRLGFAVGIHVNADILLMDEVMAVGDIGFYNKCVHHLEEVRSRGKCTLLVSHNLQRIRRMCDRVLVLDRGSPVFMGAAEPGIRCYEELIHSRQSSRTTAGGIAPEFDYLGISLLSALVCDPGSGEPLAATPQGGDAELRFTLATTAPLERIVLNVVVETIEGITLIWETLELELLPVGTHRFRVGWRELRLKSGVYPIRIGVSTGEMQGKGFRVVNAAQLKMEGGSFERGLYCPVARFELLPQAHW